MLASIGCRQSYRGYERENILLVTMVYSNAEEREALFSSNKTGAEDKQSEYRSLDRQESSSSASS